MFAVAAQRPRAGRSNARSGDLDVVIYSNATAM